MADNKDVRPHIYLGPTGKAEPFTTPPARGGGNKKVPRRNRQQHGADLQRQLEAVSIAQTALTDVAKEYELESLKGVQVAFESFPGV